MNFKEKQLVEILEKILKKQFGTNVAFRELSAGYGIADLVFAENFSFTKRNVTSRPSITNYTDLQLFLNMTQSKEYALDDLSELLFGHNEADIKRRLKVLQKNGYIEKTDNGYIRILDVHFNPIKRIIAIEAKRSDYKNGIIQARRYQYFADESYLAILKGTVKDADIDELRQYNIGLILFDRETNSVDIHHPVGKSELVQDNLNVFAKEIMLDSFSKSVSLAR